MPHFPRRTRLQAPAARAGGRCTTARMPIIDGRLDQAKPGFASQSLCNANAHVAAGMVRGKLGMVIHHLVINSLLELGLELHLVHSTQLVLDSVRLASLAGPLQEGRISERAKIQATPSAIRAPPRSCCKKWTPLCGNLAWIGAICRR